MSNNQNGFSLVELLLIITAVIGVGLIGYKVYASQNDSKAQQDDPAKVNLVRDPMSGDEETEVSKSANLTYEDIYLTFTYPGSWSSAGEEGSVKTFKSADYKAPSEKGFGPSAEAGYLLEYQTSTKIDAAYQTYEQAITSLKEAEEALGGSFETLKVDGQNAVITDIKSHGTYLEAYVFRADYVYFFRLNATDEDKPEVKSLLKEILAGVKLKATKND